MRNSKSLPTLPQKTFSMQKKIKIHDRKQTLGSSYSHFLPFIKILPTLLITMIHFFKEQKSVCSRSKIDIDPNMLPLTKDHKPSFTQITYILNNEVNPNTAKLQFVVKKKTMYLLITKIYAKVLIKKVAHVLKMIYEIYECSL